MKWDAAKWDATKHIDLVEKTLAKALSSGSYPVSTVSTMVKLGVSLIKVIAQVEKDRSELEILKERVDNLEKRLNDDS
jgi:hypothetical protein